jgi:hypothetical protein
MILSPSGTNELLIFSQLNHLIQFGHDIAQIQRPLPFRAPDNQISSETRQT